jgi:transcriptional regulator with XRE-family HTH domain
MRDRWDELGAFLRSRRARMAPRFDIPDDRRHVPGMRREEVASAAGVSTGYYTRLEQGRAPRVTDEVLNAVSRALELDRGERQHVWRLARPAPGSDSAGSEEVVRAEVVALLEAVMPTPALVLGADRHLLAWNATAHALHAPHLDRHVVDVPDLRPWWPDLLFRDARVADLFVDWPAKAEDTVADLHIQLSRNPASSRLPSLVDGLRAGSDAFDRLWSAIPTTPCAHHDRTYRQPEVGPLDLHDEFLQLGDDQGQCLALFTAAPGSPSAEALERLAATAPSI